MKRFALVLTLALALTTGFGCAKKSSGSDPGMGELTEAERAAIQQITDGRVFFAFNKFDVKPEYQSMLRQKADLIKQNARFRVRIEGNCDERGTQEYNLALGERRARAAYEYLVNLGVSPSQLEMVSFGKENPMVQGNTEAAHSKNRRDDFRVVTN